MDRLALTFTPDYNTLLQTTAALVRRRYPASLRWRLNLVYFTFMVLGGVLLGGGTAMLWYRAGLMGALVYATLLTLAMVWFTRKVVQPWIVRKSAASISSVKPAEPSHFSADADGMRWVDTTTDFHLRWAGVEAMFVEHGTLAFMTSAIAMTVPVSAFKDDEHIRAFLSLALQHLPAGAAARAKAEPSLMKLMTTRS